LLIALAGATSIGLLGLGVARAASGVLAIAVLLMALATQIRVPAVGDRWFGLGVTIAAAAPIYFGTGLRVDIGACLVVIGLGIALGLVGLVLRKALDVGHHLIGRMVAMTLYVLIFAWVLPQPAVQAIDAEWRLMLPLAVGATGWLLVLVAAMVLERRLPH
jgi:hypothetical protein